MQDHLFDPWEAERAAAAGRRRRRITPAQAEQLVFDLVSRAGGRLTGDRLLAAGLEAGLDTDAVTHAIHVLERRQAIRARGNVVSLAA